MFLFSNSNYFSWIIFKNLLGWQRTARHKDSFSYLLSVIFVLLPLFFATEAYSVSEGSNNVTSLAAITASSEQLNTNQQAVKAVDGVIDGWPGDYSREWATLGQKAGAWIELNWDSAYEVDRVVLYDRPNMNDQITEAMLTFGDGTTVKVGALNNDGSGVEVLFSPVVTNRLRVTVTGVSSKTHNVGLAELEVYGTPQTDDGMGDKGGTSNGGGSNSSVDGSSGGSSSSGDDTGNADDIKPIANNDTATTNEDVPINIDILANDSGLNDGSVTLSVVSRPSNGTVTVKPNRTITYTPNNAYVGQDPFVYKLADLEGNISVANVVVTVICTSCPADAILTPSWDPNPTEVTGYLALVCNNEEVSEGVKWYPGHYLRIWTDGSTDAAARQFLENPYTMGLTLHIKWSDLEKSEGQYDFSRIEKYLKMADAYGKKVVLKINEACFVGCNDAYAPAYIKTKYNGITTTSKGTTTNMWDPRVVDRYMALFKAIGSKYDGHPALAGTIIKGSSESVLPVPRELKVQVEDAYVEQLFRMAREAKEYFPHTITYTGINYVKGGGDNATAVFEKLAQEIIKVGGGGFTHPDTFPDEDTPAYPVERKYSDQLALFSQAQTTEMGARGISEEELYNFAVNNLGAQAISWNAWFTTRNGEQRPNYVQDYVLPVLNKYNGAINTACPTSFSKCITQCD